MAAGMCLLLGFGLGWISHCALSAPTGSVANQSAELPTSRIKPIPEKEMMYSPISGGTGAEPDGSSLNQRVAAIAWLRARGLPLGIGVTEFPTEQLGPLFISVFDLSTSEVDRLNASLAHARTKYDALVGSIATGGIGPDGTQLTVHVPPMPVEGGAIHDALFATFQQVLGPERFQLFNIVAADNFERSFDGFGLGEVHYIMDLNPSVAANGFKTYKIVRTSSNPDGSRMTSNNQLDVENALKMFPVLRRFIPRNID